MLFILTGQIQIGKTRWLQRILEELSASGATHAGVLAPGVWRETIDGDEKAFEKLGIDNQLLPDGDLVPFARRRDLALEEGSFDAQSQSARAGLGWEISDEAIYVVNEHFDDIERKAQKDGPFDLLVVDELGQLELLRDGGLTSAMRILKAGDGGVARNALVVVRDVLADTASDMLADAWGGYELIGPDDAGHDKLMDIIFQK